MTLCFSDVETREMFRRLKEIVLVFGNKAIDTLHEVVTGYISGLKKSEEKRYRWEQKSPQLHRRHTFVVNIIRICSYEKLSNQTTYQAIYLFDRFMDRHDIVEHQLYLLAIVCIVVSGKVLEIDGKIPKYRRMLRFLPKHRYEFLTTSTVIGIENLVLNAFNFDVIIPTEATFLEFFLLYGVDGKNSQTVEENNNNEVCIENTDQAVQYALDNKIQLKPSAYLEDGNIVDELHETGFLILQELVRTSPCNDFRPSCIAAAILMAARREHSLNFWTPNLEVVTSYSIEEVSQCLVNYVEPNLKFLTLAKPFEAAEFIDLKSDFYLGFVPPAPKE